MKQKSAFLISIVGLLLPIIIWGLDYKTNEITVEWVSTDSLISQTDSEAELKVLFEEKVVEKPSLNRFHIKNTGSEPIRKSDFNTPLRFHFDGDVVLLKVNVTKTFPDLIPAVLSIENNTVELHPILLNSDDIVNFSVILSGELDSVSATGRIAKISKIELEKSDLNKLLFPRYISYAFSIVFLAFIYCYFAFKVLNRIEMRIPRWFAVCCAFSSAIAFTVMLKKVLFFMNFENLYFPIAITIILVTIFGIRILQRPRLRQ